MDCLDQLREYREKVAEFQGEIQQLQQQPWWPILVPEYERKLSIVRAAADQLHAHGHIDLEQKLEVQYSLTLDGILEEYHNNNITEYIFYKETN